MHCPLTMSITYYWNHETSTVFHRLASPYIACKSVTTGQSSRQPPCKGDNKHFLVQHIMTISVKPCLHTDAAKQTTHMQQSKPLIVLKHSSNRICKHGKHSLLAQQSVHVLCCPVCMSETSKQALLITAASLRTSSCPAPSSSACLNLSSEMTSRQPYPPT